MKIKTRIGNYEVEKFENSFIIDYKRSTKDFYYIIIYFIISIPFFFFSLKLISYLIFLKLNIDIIIGYFFCIGLFCFGLYFFIVSIETLLKPTKKVFFINFETKQLLIKKNLLKTISFNFSEIKNFNIRASKQTFTTYIEGRTINRKLYLILMYIELINNKTIKIHQFEGPNLLISNNENLKNKSLKEVSVQISHLISEACEKKCYWKGTINE